MHGRLKKKKKKKKKGQRREAQQKTKELAIGKLGVFGFGFVSDYTFFFKKNFLLN
jgi:hypothetical protein